MSDFKPYKEEETYKCELTKTEALLIQKLRDVSFGSVTVHVISNKIVRTETLNSQLMRDQEGDKVTIAFEVISN